MRRLFVLVLFVGAIIGIFVTPPVAIGVMYFTELDAGKTFTLEVGSVFSVELPVQARTGYSWVLASDDQRIENIGTSSGYVVPGATDVTYVQHFLLKAAMYGSSVVTFNYQRRGVGGAPVKSFQITVEVPR